MTGFRKKKPIPARTGKKLKRPNKKKGGNQRLGYTKAPTQVEMEEKGVEKKGLRIMGEEKKKKRPLTKGRVGCLGDD